MAGPQTFDPDGEARAFRTFFELASAGVCLVGLDGRVLAANRAFARIFDVPADGPEVRRFRLTNPDPFDPANQFFSELASGKREAYTFERRVPVRSGGGVDLRVEVFLVRAESGEPQFALAAVTPIEDDGHARAAAHDLNNLLTVIGGRAQLLVSRLDPGPEAGDAESILEAAQRSSAIVRRLLDDGGARPQWEPVDVNDVIAGMNGIAAQLAGDGIAIRLRLDPARPHAAIDPQGLERAVANLVANARAAMPDGGTVTVTTQTGGDKLLISVADTGTGIEPQLLEHVFEPGVTTKGDGRGFGLANVRRFADRSGGWTAVESEPGRGTTVTIVVPAASEV